MIKTLELKRFKKFEHTTIELGELSILVGENSSGKTTILSLIVRNYEIQKGQILIDGMEQGNMTAIISSHNLRELEDLCESFRADLNECVADSLRASEWGITAVRGGVIRKPIVRHLNARIS